MKYNQNVMRCDVYFIFFFFFGICCAKILVYEFVISLGRITSLYFQLTEGTFGRTKAFFLGKCSVSPNKSFAQDRILLYILFQFMLMLLNIATEKRN